MKRLYYFNQATVIRNKKFQPAGMEKFAAYFKLFNAASVPIDRTGNTFLPISVTSLFPIPELRPFKKTYEEVCNERAQELLARAEKLDCPLYAFWSGGIDSTTVLVSLLKNATPAQKERIVVLLSEESVNENPAFYRDHIRGKLRRESSRMFPYFLGTDALFVNGEHNDQLFGSEMVGMLMKRNGDATAEKRYDRELFLSHFGEKIGDEDLAAWYVEFFEKFWAAAPIELPTNHDRIWWINFATHWQSVYMRTLLYTAERNKKLISTSYITERYEPFFRTEDFQLWSMHNLDKKIKDTWETYKWPAKDIIYEYTKDARYRDTKIKRGSLFLILTQEEPFNYIDESFSLSRTCDLQEYYNPNNSFI